MKLITKEWLLYISVTQNEKLALNELQTKLAEKYSLKKILQEGIGV